ncbi:MAG: lipopolysaccharide transport system permease protein [Solirubrobacterales bacterium]|nr:lipopolysaccharide transport system permease protein [Solirubrobacterales bacterium]
MSTAEAQIAAVPEVVIAPPSRWSGIQLGELWAHRELIYFLTKRELQVRYKQSVFGVSWAVLQPLAFAFIFAAIFGTLVNLPTQHIPFAVYAIVGLVPWLFTAGAIGNGATSLVQDANLISKVYFPRLALPISKALSLIVDLVIGVPVVLLMIAIYGVGIEATAPLAILFLALGVITAFGLGTLFAAVNVKYRDVGLIVPVFIQLMFFATPILWSVVDANGNHIRDGIQYILAINPMFSAIEGVRWAVIGTNFPGWPEIAISAASSLVILFVALRYFQSAEQSFADNI